MDTIPEDVLRLIFETYTYKLNCSPASLLTVSRHWHAVLITTRRIWSRVPIHITSFDTVPSILQVATENGPNTRSPLRSYLDRTRLPEDLSLIPLDIEIVFHQSRQEENFQPPLRRAKWVFEAQNRLKSQLDTLWLHLAGLDVEEMTPTDSDAGDGKLIGHQDFIRWRSITLHGQNSRAYWPRVSTSFKCLKLRGCRSLPSIKILSFKNIRLSFRHLTMPRLIHLDSENCSLYSFPEVPSLKSLAWIYDRRWKPGDNFYINWSKCDKMEKIQTSLAKTTVETYEWPDLSTIIFHRALPTMIDETMLSLQTRFTRQHPMDTLGLSQSSVRGLEEMFDAVPDFHTRILKLSSRLFHDRPSGVIWEWDECGTVNWPVKKYEMRRMRRLLKMMDARGTNVEAMDVHMEGLIKAARMHNELSDSDSD
jgi:hypothetical protein